MRQVTEIIFGPQGPHTPPRPMSVAEISYRAGMMVLSNSIRDHYRALHAEVTVTKTGTVLTPRQFLENSFHQLLGMIAAWSYLDSGTPANKDPYRVARDVFGWDLDAIAAAIRSRP